MISLKINPKIKSIIFLFLMAGLLWGLKSYNSGYSQLIEGNQLNISLNQNFSEEEEDEKDPYEFDYFLLSHSLKEVLKSHSKLTIHDFIVKSELISSVTTPPPNLS